MSLKLRTRSHPSLQGCFSGMPLIPLGDQNVLKTFEMAIRYNSRSRVVSVLGSGAEGPGFESQPRRCQETVLGKLCIPIVPLFTKHRN